MALDKNTVTLRGHMATQLEGRYTASGMLIATGRMGINRRGAKARAANNGKGTPDFFNVRLFDAQAALLINGTPNMPPVGIGDYVEVEGSLRTETWRDANDGYHEKTYINVNSLDILRRKGDYQPQDTADGQPDYAAAPQDGDDGYDPGAELDPGDGGEPIHIANTRARRRAA